MGNFELVQEQLHLGDALGNRFEITLRCATAAAARQPIPSHHCSYGVCNVPPVTLHARGPADVCKCWRFNITS